EDRGNVREHHLAERLEYVNVKNLAILTNGVLAQRSIILILTPPRGIVPKQLRINPKRLAGLLTPIELNEPIVCLLRAAVKHLREVKPLALRVPAAINPKEPTAFPALALATGPPGTASFTIGFAGFLGAHLTALPFFGLPFGLFCAAISVRTNSSSSSGTCFSRSFGVQIRAVQSRDNTDKSMLPCSPRFCSIRRSVL